MIDPRVLRVGWGGELSPDEVKYIAEHLVKDAELRRQWKVRKWVHYPRWLIRAKAFPERHGDIDDWYKRKPSGKSFKPGNQYQFKSRKANAEIE